MSKYGWKQLGFQNPATPIAEGIIDLHDYIMFYITIIFIFVFWVYFDMLLQNLEIFNFSSGFLSSIDEYIHEGFKLRRLYFFLNRINHATDLEVVWTLLPSFILIIIAIPSLSLLYSMDELLYPKITLKVTGLQWYWTYEYSDTFINLEFAMGCLKGLPLKSFVKELPDIASAFSNYKFSDLFIESYMVADSEIFNFRQHRLLSADKPVVLPIHTHIRVLVTGADVLHSWAVPSFGIKIDAVPGRLNQVAIYLKRQGVFYGQCSELCGVNHGFMPIVVKSVTRLDFDAWAQEYMFAKWKSRLHLL